MAMRKRTALIFATLLLIVAAAIIGWFSADDDEPRYKGRSLSYWLEAYGTGEDQLQAAEAIETIGTNGFPLLFEWMCKREPQPPALLVRTAALLPRPLRPKWVYGSDIPRYYL